MCRCECGIGRKVSVTFRSVDRKPYVENGVFETWGYAPDS